MEGFFAVTGLREVILEVVVWWKEECACDRDECAQTLPKPNRTPSRLLAALHNRGARKKVAYITP